MPETPLLKTQRASSTEQPTSQVQHLTVESAYAGQRIDNFLLTFLKGVPKSLVYRILRKGEVRVNKGRIKPEYRLCAGDVLRIPPVRRDEAKAQAQPSKQLCELLSRSILLETPQLLVVNKPAGLAVHGGSGVELGLIEALRQLRPQDKHLELVHRLDKETSGCLLIAKKRSALRFLQDAMRERNIEKRYLALVQGKWPRACKEVNAPLLKYTLPSGERRVRVNTEGKPSRTLFRVVERFKECTLLEAQLETGRTHQIRVHSLHTGCPLVGDEKYNQLPEQAALQGFKRLCLHAQYLAFPAPPAAEADDRAALKNRQQTMITIEAPMPEDLDLPLQALRGVRE